MAKLKLRNRDADDLNIYDLAAYFIGSNALLYLLFHIPLDIITLTNKKEHHKSDAEEYPPWSGQSVFKIFTIFASIFFWLFFILWPILHLLSADNFILFFNFTIPILGEIFQYIGLVLVIFGSIIAITGRISRGVEAISWGVPNKLTTRGLFRVIRHPLYSSYCFYFVGIPLSMLNYLLIPLLFGIIGYYYSAKYEEEILVKEFGQEYQIYQSKAGMFLPFIGRKKLEERNDD